MRRIIARLLKFLVTWLLCAVIIGLIMVSFFPPRNPQAIANSRVGLGPDPAGYRFGLGVVRIGPAGPMRVGIGAEPWNLPGTIVGFIVAVRVVKKRRTDAEVHQ